MITLLLALLLRPLEVCNPSFQLWPDSYNITHILVCLDGAAPDLCISADAGASFTSAPGTLTSLDGTGTVAAHTPSAITYQWQQLENGMPQLSLGGNDTVTPSFEASIIGEYQFELTASWYCRQESDRVTVTIERDSIPAELNAVFVADIPCQVVQLTAATAKDERLFVVTKVGIIYIIKNGILLTTPFLDLRGEVTSSCDGGQEQGLLGMAFHPEYEQNGLFYVNYSDDFGSINETRIVGYGTHPTNPDLADTTSATLLLTIPQPQSNHNGGQLLFGPDAYLYIGMGDGGGGGDSGTGHGTMGNGQDPQTLLGKMLRFQVNGLNSMTLPASNPFVGDPTTLDEIWALGLRNPWRFSFDRQSGDLFIGDVGQGSWEEVSYQPATSPGGENYGWRLKEGSHCFNPTTNCDPGGLTDPIHEYSSTGSYCSIIGGFVYRGLNIPALNGYYVFTDWCASGSSGVPNYNTLRYNGSVWEANDLDIFVDDVILRNSVVGFGEDNQGELYLCHSSGLIHRITSIRSYLP